MKFTVVLLLGILLTICTSAQNDTDNCNPNFDLLHDRLNEAQTAFDAGNRDEFKELFRRTRLWMQMDELVCEDYSSVDAGASRGNPVPFGQTQEMVSQDDFTGAVRVLSINEDATQTILDAASVNDPPQAGMKYIIVEIEATCTKDTAQSCELGWGEFAVVGDGGIAYERIFENSGFSNMEAVEFFGGTTIQIAYPFMVKEGDTNFLLFNQLEDDARVFFATK